MAKAHIKFRTDTPVDLENVTAITIVAANGTATTLQDKDFVKFFLHESHSYIFTTPETVFSVTGKDIAHVTISR